MSAARVPIVDYLDLDGDQPHLVAYRCSVCGAHYFDRRNACAACSTDAFTRVAVPTTGIVRTYTIVEQAGPGIEVPFVAAVVDCGGISVRCNLTGVTPDAAHVTTGAEVELTTYSLGVDDSGVEAVGFAFGPATTSTGRVS